MGYVGKDFVADVKRGFWAMVILLVCTVVATGLLSSGYYRGLYNPLREQEQTRTEALKMFHDLRMAAETGKTRHEAEIIAEALKEKLMLGGMKLDFIGTDEAEVVKYVRTTDGRQAIKIFVVESAEAKQEKKGR